MSFSTSAAAVCLIACHGGPADHFATFAEKLSPDVGAIEIYASGQAVKKFQDRGIGVKYPFSIDTSSEDALAEQIAKACSNARVVITDVGHAFDIKIQKALALHATGVPRFAYYDNPEDYVPGGYSAVAAEVMLAAQKILFANSNLAQSPIFREKGQEIDFENRKRVGIGYYPIKQAENIAQRRSTEHSAKRQAFFQKNGLNDTDQKTLVYFGANNEEYFSKAFPAFLSLLEKGMERADFTNLLIILQQHPTAKEKNLDGNIIEPWINTHKDMPQAPKIFISDFNSDDAQILADGALYYQTSMGPQFVLAGIPTMQIGHERYKDILVKNELCPSVTDVDQLIEVIDGLTRPKEEVQQERILNGLGIKKNWLQTLETAIKEANTAPVPIGRQISLGGFTIKRSHLPYYLAAGGAILIGIFAIRFFKFRHS